MNRSVLLEMTRGATFSFGFGVLWVLTGSLTGLFGGRPLPAWAWLSLLLMGIALGASIATLGLRASRLRRDTVPPTAQQLAATRAIVRRFNLISGIQGTAISLAVALLIVNHYPGYIVCAVALIVGVHFFPLAWLFKASVYYATGWLGCAIAVAGFVVADVVLRQQIVGMSFGLLLWATAAWTVRKGLSATSRIVSDLPSNSRDGKYD